ncbi:MAG: glycosyltransferase family 2 protein [Candidatus Omnitrophica bacterium]|nr:glycosyltransferase family 2 protein [Candidatus Omnitrophota bacterium]
MNVSIIVPAYNAANTLECCLTSIASEMTSEDELILVDDGSTDNTSGIAAKYQAKVIAHPKNLGLPVARQTGMDAAGNEICVYFDADVELEKGCLVRIKNKISDNPDYSAFTGTYSVDQPFRCIWSKYKSYTTSFNMRSLPDNVTFVNGAVFAVRKPKSPRFDQIEGFYGEDASYGQLLIESGEKILFDKKITVRHHHKHTALSALQHSFFVSEAMIRLFARHEGWKKHKQNRGSFGSAPKSLLVSLLFPAAIFINFVLAVTVSLKSVQLISLFFFMWLLMNLKFFIYCSRNETNVRFLAFLVPMTFIEQFIRLAGLVSGAVSVAKNRIAGTGPL